MKWIGDGAAVLGEKINQFFSTGWVLACVQKHFCNFAVGWADDLLALTANYG
ncbi:MAG: hypothetical protein Q4E41_02980 [Bacteroidales bacterium]|nr:hypothetical protein [Bacteroidales bacterium]